jgi:peptide/nickel transport system substrate-binding protein
MEIAFENWIALYPQFLNPNPPILQNVQFRRALLHALDRQNLVDTLQYGTSPVAHVFLNPGEAAYRDVEPNLIRYDYDTRRAAQLLEGVGLVKGPDALYRDASGQTIPLEVRTSGGDDAHEAGVLVIADELRTLGIAADPFLIPQARRSDLEYNQTFPGLRLWRKDNTLWAPQRWHSKETPLPENRFIGSNDARYMSSALDGLIDRYVATIPRAERTQILGQIVHHVSDQVIQLGLWYNTEPHAVSSKLKGRGIKRTAGVNDVWNAHEWVFE